MKKKMQHKPENDFNIFRDKIGKVRKPELSASTVAFLSCRAVLYS